MRETDIMNLIKLEASTYGIRLWRNNVGAAYMQDGTFIRYGLANETTQMNEIIKSSDLIGIKPILITPEMVGKTIGQFISREIKTLNWKFRATKREVAQQNWIELIRALGGDADFANQTGTFNRGV